MSQKIPWFPTSNAPIGATLVISGESLSLPHRSFSQSFSVAHALDGSQRMMFPSILAPPAPGCWLFTLSSGQATATIAVRVRARVKSPS